MHKLLLRQMKRLGLSNMEGITSYKHAWERLLLLVSETYIEAEKGRDRIERSLMLVSEELTERNRALSKSCEELKQNQSTIRYQASHDSLTSLPNRAYLMEQLHRIVLSQSKNNHAAVLFIDLDNFKKVNDSCGHAVGDELLKLATQRLKYCLRSTDILARFGGDEFIVVLRDAPNPKLIEEICGRFLSQLSAPCQIDNHTFHISGSIGVSLFPQSSTNPDTLLKMADLAMYEAKTQGKNNFCFFNRSLESIARNQLEVEQHLHQIIEERKLELRFQPIVSPNDQRLESLEAQIHFETNNDHVITRGEYLDISEKTGLIKELMMWIIDACQNQVRQWKKNGIDAPPIFLTLSKHTFFDPDLTQKLIGSTPDIKWAIRIGEPVLAKNSAEVIETITKFREIGIKIAIEGFGSGFASLLNFQNFTADYLITDKILVEKVTQSERNKTIVKSTTALAHRLNTSILADFIKDEVTSDVMTASGCDLLMGNYISVPLSIDETKRLLEIKSKPQTHFQAKTKNRSGSIQNTQKH